MKIKILKAYDDVTFRYPFRHKDLFQDNRPLAEIDTDPEYISFRQEYAKTQKMLQKLNLAGKFSEVRDIFIELFGKPDVNFYEQEYFLLQPENSNYGLFVLAQNGSWMTMRFGCPTELIKSVNENLEALYLDVIKEGEKRFRKREEARKWLRLSHGITTTKEEAALLGVIK